MTRWHAALGAAGAVALVTVAARVVGFGRVAVLSRTLGTSCVGDTYTAVNALPNVVYEVVAGGALAAFVVPVLAGAVAAGDRDAVSRTTSALLTWTLLVLVPVAFAGALAAPLLVRALLGDDPSCRGAVEVGSRMLVVFMPQVALYGVGIVLAGVLQAHRRFLGPALAPLLSSLVVVTAYLLYAAGGAVDELAELSRRAELVLSVGTTLGVAVLSLSLLVPLRSCGLRLRPALRFPPGVAARARRLAAGGVLGLAAQQLALLVALRLAANGGQGSVVVFTVATALFLLPWAVLAVPVATSAFPTLTAAADRGDASGYAAELGRALRPVVLAMSGAAALLAVGAGPAALLLVRGAPGLERSGELARATAAFAPGLVGYGLLALLVRAAWARGDARTPATATALGWLTVAGTDLALVTALPQAERGVLLGVGNTVGVTVAALVLLLHLRRTAGRSALTGATRSAAAGAGAAGAAVGLGAALTWVLPDGRVAVGLAVTAVAAAVWLAVARLLDPSGLQELRRA